MLSNCVQKIKFVHQGSFIKIRKHMLVSSRFSSDQTVKPIYQPDFTVDQQKYILQQLNGADTEQLIRYSLPKNRIKKLNDWKKKYGSFNSLSDVLDIDGLGVKTLDKLCKNILNGEEGNVSETKEKQSKIRGQILTPALNIYQSKNLTSALGVHLFANGVSWAKIEKEKNFLSDWSSFEFNLGSKKLSPSDALQLVIKLSSIIPTSDVYVFETPMSVTPTAQQSPVSVAIYVQRVQLLSMLIALLSTTNKHNPTFAENDIIATEPKVFFLRHRLSARLFRTLIGTERVSAAATVSNILLNEENSEKIMYTPITVTEDLQKMYNRQSPVTKEILGQSLLLIMTFFDVCVYQNPHSLKIVASNSR